MYCIPMATEIPNRWRCANCGFTDMDRAGKFPDRIFRICKKQRTAPCSLLGEATGETVECPTCKGSVKLKLFACECHGRCTLEKSLESVTCCRSCVDYVELSAPTAQLAE